jgi:hypothetical protein
MNRSKNIKRLVCLACSASTDIGCLGEAGERMSEEVCDWDCWMPSDETAQAALPISDFEVKDTSPIGLSVVLTRVVENEPQWPIMMAYTTDGTLICFSVIDDQFRSEGYKLIRDARQIPQPDAALVPFQQAVVKFKMINEDIELATALPENESVQADAPDEPAMDDQDDTHQTLEEEEVKVIRKKNKWLFLLAKPCMFGNSFYNLNG